VLMRLVIAEVAFGVRIPNVFTRESRFRDKTTKNILKFYEFFYDEYVFIRAEKITYEHQNYPNFRACVIFAQPCILEEHTTARYVVSIAKIEKYLDDVKYNKEIDIRNSDTMQEWIKNDVKMLVRGETEEMLFACEIKTMLEDHILNPSLKDIGRKCGENKPCITKLDFMKCSYFNKYDQNIRETYNVDSISNDEISMKTEKISRGEKRLRILTLTIRKQFQQIRNIVR